jgi:hypothetical protein
MTGTPRFSEQPSRSAALWRALEAIALAVAVGAAVVAVWPRAPQTILERVVADRALGAIAANSTGDSIVPALQTPISVIVRARVPGEDSLIAVVVGGNIFSATRRAPLVAFRVPGQLDDVPGSMTSAMSGNDLATGAPSFAAMGGVVDTARYPQLFGLVMLGSERLALLQLRPGDGSPRLYRAGDRASGYRVLRIESSRAQLSGPRGVEWVSLAPAAPNPATSVPPDTIPMTSPLTSPR